VPGEAGLAATAQYLDDGMKQGEKGIMGYSAAQRRAA